jgi:hypothetical protein
MCLKLLKIESVLVPIIQTGPDMSTAYFLDALPWLRVAEKAGVGKLKHAPPNGGDAFRAAFWQNGRRNSR